MIAGDLVPRDPPRSLGRGLAGIARASFPGDDRQGCLQDIHWYDGVLGLFPDPTRWAALIAAQLFEAARAPPSPDVLEAIATG